MFVLSDARKFRNLLKLIHNFSLVLQIWKKLVQREVEMSSEANKPFPSRFECNIYAFKIKIGIVLIPLLLTFTDFTHFSGASIVAFEHINTAWEEHLFSSGKAESISYLFSKFLTISATFDLGFVSSSFKYSVDLCNSV